VLIGSGIGLLPVDQNAPVGQSTDAQFTIQEALIDPGTVIFAYTQGLTDAKDKDRRPFGQQRMMGEALQTIHGLDPTPKPFVERMTATLHRFTGDTEQDDDITMFAIRYLKKASGGRYQRTITLPNDKNEMLRLPTFLEEVCKAMNFDKQTTENIILTVKEAVSSMAAYAYADGTKGDIQVEAYADKAQLQFVIRDYGEPFDPTTKLKLRSINAMSYERMNLPPEIATAEKTGQNILTLTKALNVEL
jgi:sigma-B regulation protein RsbU (phosphoserine phosphatase)